MPEMPDEIDDRAAEGVEALFAIADLAGADWAKRARASIVSVLKRKTCEEPSWGVQLLSSICMVWLYEESEQGGLRLKNDPEDKLFTDDLLNRLKGEPEEPWANWGKTGEGLDSRGLA
jgi:hypothetical protein